MSANDVPWPHQIELLRVTTAGSVDDGKSTLVGRLLYDSGAIFDDQLQSLARASRSLCDARLDLALLTDGLRAEREQKITIDVAYRYFATPRRKFIIADTPGHLQYTRNMVTGASSADLAVILVDATKGLLTQSRRHAFLATLLGIPHLLIAINKMDAVGYAEEVYERIVREFTTFASKLTVSAINFVPVSALEGDNVVTRSSHMPWYHGGSLLHQLETVNVGARLNAIDFRFPVQYVIRPDHRFRGFAGTVASGSIQRGDEIVVLPSGASTRVRSIETFDETREEARAGDSIVLTTADEIDISRGDMIVRARNLPLRAARLEAYLCWMHGEPLALDRPYVLQHTTRQVQAFVKRIEYRVDVDTMHRVPVRVLELNDIARVELTATEPLFVDSYRMNVSTGSFILIDPDDNRTAAAGMIRGEVRELRRPSSTVSPNVVWQGCNLPRVEREAANGHRAAVVWLTGLPGAGKTTIARAVERLLLARTCRTILIDGDQLRHGLCGDLGFTREDRAENVRRAGEVAKLCFEHGNIVLCAFVSPYRRDRDCVRALVPEGCFFEVLVTARTETCQARDPKHLYAKAEQRAIVEFTGLSAPYERPDAPELTIDTDRQSIAEAAQAVIDRLLASSILVESHRLAPARSGQAAVADLTTSSVESGRDA